MNVSDSLKSDYDKQACYDWLSLQTPYYKVHRSYISKLSIQIKSHFIMSKKLVKTIRYQIGLSRQIFNPHPPYFLPGRHNVSN
jgi:hypothetical protein